MQRYWIIVAAIIILNSSAAVGQICEDEDFKDLPVVVRGTNVFEFLRDTVARDELFEEFLVLTQEDKPIEFANEAELSNIVRSLEGTGPRIEVPEVMNGVSGFSTYLFSLAVLGDLNRVTGKIRDYVYNSTDRTGHLAVDLRVETSRGVICYHWDIDVVRNVSGYRVLLRDPEWKLDSDTSPFPDSDIEFDEPTRIRIDSRGLDHKLVAEGTDIVVRHVYRQVDAGSIERLDDAHEFYRSTAESCIDLMTAGPPPPLTLAPRQANDELAYCLGRCVHPPIVNTE